MSFSDWAATVSIIGAIGFTVTGVICTVMLVSAWLFPTKHNVTDRRDRC